MTVTIFAASSLCLQSGAAGWGAVVLKGGAAVTMQGPMAVADTKAVVMADLQGIQSAVEAAMRRRWIGTNDRLILVVRSTAATALLKWAFPGAQFEGLPVPAPKRLKPEVQDSIILQNLRADIDAAGLMEFTVRVMASNRHSRTAIDAARHEMRAIAR